MFCCYPYFAHEKTEPQNGSDNGPRSHSWIQIQDLAGFKCRSGSDSNLGSLISVPALSLSKVWPHGIHIKIQKTNTQTKSRSLNNFPQFI